MGTGKTASTLSALLALRDACGEDWPVLVVAPLRVAQSVWPDELAKWEQFRGLEASVMCGTPAQRAAAFARRAFIHTINHENLPWLREHAEANGGWPFRTVVADEASRLQSFRIRQGGKQAAALGKVAHVHVERWINLTGTPAANGLEPLWGQQWFVDRGAALGRTFSAFEARWFAWRVQDPKRPYSKIKTLLPGAQAQVEGELQGSTITVRAADHLGLPPLVRNVIKVDLPPAARRAYRELKRDMCTALEGGSEVRAISAADVSVKCLQAANGALYTGDAAAAARDWAPLHDAKLDAVRSVVEEAAGAPVLVAYHFKSDLERLRKAFPSGRHLDKNPQTITDWNAGRIPVMFAHPASAGHGLNLQHGGNTLVFFGLWWNLEAHEQIIERIGPTRQAQSGYNRAVFVHYIVARSTVDEQVMERLETKADIQTLLLQAMQRNQE
jgi:SNF2 family DNA or RNA helicase